MASGRSTAVGVAIGAALLGGLVVGELLSTSYRADLSTICHAEARSGRPLAEGMAEVTGWTRAHLRTPEGNAFFASLRYAPYAARADLLRREASARGVGRCPLVDSYARLARDGVRRSELQALCSAVTFPGLVERDDAARLALLVDWIDRRGGPEDRSLADALASATPDRRGAVLRAAARSAGALSCPVAGLLDLAPPDAGAP